MFKVEGAAVSEHDVAETPDGPGEADPQSPVLDEARSNSAPPELKTARVDRPGGGKKKPDKPDKPSNAGKADKKPKDKKQRAVPLPEQPEPPMSRRRGISGPWAVVMAVLTVLLMVLVAGCVLLGVRVIHDRRINSARASALGAAQQYATDFGTYDYKNLDASFARIANDLTGTFKDTYSRTAASLKATVIQYQEQATAAVQGAGVTSVSPHQAVVIVLFDQSVRSINSTTPVINRTRARITLVRSGGGRWLMSALDLK
jgi:Mce-associated membrane protein